MTRLPERLGRFERSQALVLEIDGQMKGTTEIACEVLSLKGRICSAAIKRQRQTYDQGFGVKPFDKVAHI